MVLFIFLEHDDRLSGRKGYLVLVLGFKVMERVDNFLGHYELAIWVAGRVKRNVLWRRGEVVSGALWDHCKGKRSDAKQNQPQKLNAIENPGLAE